jgi:alkyl hydroperoxide reductase subunit AhpC
LDAQVVGMSIDSVFSHVAWQKYEVGWLNFPIGSDFYPHGEVASSFGILRTGDPVPGMTERAVFVIDKQGIIRYANVLDLGEVPDNEEALEVLRQIQAKKAGTSAD